MNPQQYQQGYGMPVGQPMAQTQTTAPISNTNQSSDKLVGYMWKRIAMCAIVLCIGLFIAIIVLVFIMNNVNVANAKQEAATTEANNKLKDIYSALKVEDQSAALTVIGQDEMLSGGDIAQIKTLLTKKYSTVTAFDATDTSTNLVKTNGVYKVVSLKMTNAAGTARALLYAKLADNQWKLANYDGANEGNPCKNSTDEEKEALKGIVKCPSVVIEDDEDNEE